MLLFCVFNLKTYFNQHSRGSFRKVFFLPLISPPEYKPLRLKAHPKTLKRSCISPGLITGILWYVILICHVFLQGGWFSGLSGIIQKVIPRGPNEMILPDDSKKSVRSHVHVTHCPTTSLQGAKFCDFKIKIATAKLVGYNPI